MPRKHQQTELFMKLCVCCFVMLNGMKHLANKKFFFAEFILSSAEGLKMTGACK